MKKQPKNTFFNLILGYKGFVLILFLFALFSNGITLALPRLIATALDDFIGGTFVLEANIQIFSLVVLAIFAFGLFQIFVGSWAAEKVGMDLRSKLINKVSRFSFAKLSKISPDSVLTNITSDVEAIKEFVSMALPFVFSAIILLIGSIIAVLSLNVELAIPVLLTLPVIIVLSMVIFSRLGSYFTKSQGIVDLLNKIITENIVAAALIRVISSQRVENKKFIEVNKDSREVGIKILNAFALYFPILIAVFNTAMIIILWQGGIKVINQELTFGEFTAFFAYIQTLIFPIIILGFISQSIGKAMASYQRVSRILNTSEEKDVGTVVKEIKGEVRLENASLTIKNKPVLKNMNLHIKPGSKTAIIGPTASGKTQLINLIIGLVQPTEGKVLVDDVPITEFEKNSLYKQIGLVFQDSILFNTTIRENLAFREEITEESFDKAIKTAEINSFIDSLPNGLDTLVSERGTSLSGGQKQRLTLARALALNPKILLLDDFTARVDLATENRILANLQKNYPETTIIMISQKIQSVKDFDQIILIMEGEVVATGKHNELLKKSLEYKMIFESQQTTE